MAGAQAVQHQRCSSGLGRAVHWRPLRWGWEASQIKLCAHSLKAQHACKAFLNPFIVGLPQEKSLHQVQSITRRTAVLLHATCTCRSWECWGMDCMLQGKAEQ